VVFAIRHHRFDSDPLPGVFDAWERIQQNRADPTEDGRVSADAERKREYCDGGEAGILPQYPQPVMNVL
jgi:hypothetical protein